jgi:folate-binding protein YgfZ
VEVGIERDLVVASGVDAAAFLQGQLSQDVDAIAEGASDWSFLLQPDGKLVAWLRVTRTAADTFLLDVDATFGATVVARLERFKLRTKCDFVLSTRAWRAVRTRDEIVPPAPEDDLVLPIAWPGVNGYDVLLPEGASAPAGDTAAYEAIRIEAGVPAMGRELTDRTIPGEAGQSVVDASVSFAKGCYTGQELVARIDSRGGHVPRPVRGLVLAGAGLDALPPVGAAVDHDGKPAGALTSVAWSAARGAGVALAPLARAVELGASVDVVWDGGARRVTARVEPLPLVRPNSTH